MPTFGSLFAGIGGIDLGLERAGWTGRWQVEWDPFCQRVLERHWPGLPRYGDITTVDWSTVERVDLLAGGFPCQPFSIAGRQKAQEDERWLWPEFQRAIRALRPRLVLVENVTNLLTVNDGTAFGEVVGDLASLGYDSRWDCVPASAVGALHERDRLWIVARSELPRSLADADDWGPFHAFQAGRDATRTSREDMADSDGQGLQGHGRLGADRGSSGERSPGSGGWSVESIWEPEPNVGRVAHGVPSRVDRIRAIGNAVVPQVVEVIGRQLIASLEEVAS